MRPADTVDWGQIGRWNALFARYRSAVDGLRTEVHRLPLNHRSEGPKVEQAYLAGRGYEPRFEYHAVVPRAGRALHQLVDDCPDDHWGRLLAAQCRAVVADLGALSTHRGADVTAASVGLYGEVDPAALAYAREVLRGPSVGAEERTCGSDALVAAMTAALARAGMGKWSVATDANMIAKASCGGGVRYAWVREGSRFGAREVRRLVLHELGCHAMRQENGSHQPLRLMGSGTGAYLATEEGLALWLEHQWGLATAADRRRYCLRLVLVHESLRHSFSELYAMAREHMGPEDAFLTCVRVRRGFADQGEPGAHVRDKVYLEGLLAVTTHLDAHPEDLDLLLSGKVALGSVGAVRELAAAGTWVPPVHRPEDLGVRREAGAGAVRALVGAGR